MKANDAIPGLGSKGVKPNLNTNADLRNAKLSPTEGFVLSRVDGNTSYADICHLTGLGSASTIEILQRLKDAGFILNPGETPPAAASAKRVPSEPPSRVRSQTSGGVDGGVLARLDDGSAVDPADLIDGPDLDPLVKKRLIRVSRRLPKLSAHEILGVSKDADVKTVKKAYLLASKELHPDRFYGKNLGMFRALLERLFRAVAEAFESLEKSRA